MRARRLPLLLLLALSWEPATAAAQRVGLEVTLTADTLVNGRQMRLPQVRTSNLLTGRWGQALRSSLPLRILYEIEIWRSRDGWIDQFERAVQIGFVFRHEALFDQYTVTEPQGRETTLATWEMVERYLTRETLVLARPASSGTYYFNVKLTVRTLSESDLDELERFMRGEAAGPESGRERERERETSGRQPLQFLLRMTGGLPSETVEKRTEKFVVR